MIADRRPIFVRIKKHIMEDINSGVLKEGFPLPSRSKLCERFSTTRVTLDKAINELVSEGVLFSRKGSGTFVKEQKFTGKIAVVAFPQLYMNSQPFDLFNFSDIYTGAIQELASQGIEYESFSLELLESMVGQMDEFIEKHTLRGIINAGYFKNDMECAEVLNERGIPLIIVSCWDKGLNAHLISDDVEDSGIEIIDYLASMGHKSIACIAGPYNGVASIPRLNAYLKGMHRNNLPIDNSLIIRCDRPKEVAEKLPPLFSFANRPSAVFATTDLRGIWAMETLREMGLKVPEDVSVTGIDDMEKAAYTDPPLTTLRTPRVQMGREAVKMMMDEIRRPSTRKVQRIMKSEFIIRQSVSRKKT